MKKDRDGTLPSGGADRVGILRRALRHPLGAGLIIVLTYCLVGAIATLLVNFFTGGGMHANHPTTPPTSITEEPTEPTEEPPATPMQTMFLEDVSKDRKTLVPGDFWYPNSASSAVGESTSVTVGLWMGGKNAGHTGPSAPLPAGSKIRHIPVGGVEGASLTSPSNEVKIRPLFDSSVKQVVTQPRDWAEWEWAVSASEPGDYKLMLRVTTYQGESNRALATSRPVSVRLHVTNTVSHRVSWLRGELVAWGGVAAAVVALLAFRTPLLAFVRARRDSSLERRRRGSDGYM
jgi:hypothetical protein